MSVIHLYLKGIPTLGQHLHDAITIDRDLASSEKALFLHACAELMTYIFM